MAYSTSYYVFCYRLGTSRGTYPPTTCNSSNHSIKIRLRNHAINKHYSLSLSPSFVELHPNNTNTSVVKFLAEISISNSLSQNTTFSMRFVALVFLVIRIVFFKSRGVRSAIETRREWNLRRNRMAGSIKKRNSYGMGRLLLVAHNMKLKTDHRKYIDLF